MGHYVQWKKRQLGQNVEKKKIPLGQNVESNKHRQKITSHLKKRRKIKNSTRNNVEWKIADKGTKGQTLRDFYIIFLHKFHRSSPYNETLMI